jgi:hypothetical protein
MVPLCVPAPPPFTFDQEGGQARPGLRRVDVWLGEYQRLSATRRGGSFGPPRFFLQRACTSCITACKPGRGSSRPRAPLPSASTV